MADNIDSAQEIDQVVDATLVAIHAPNAFLAVPHHRLAIGYNAEDAEFKLHGVKQLIDDIATVQANIATLDANEDNVAVIRKTRAKVNKFKASLKTALKNAQADAFASVASDCNMINKSLDQLIHSIDSIVTSVDDQIRQRRKEELEAAVKDSLSFVMADDKLNEEYWMLCIDQQFLNKSYSIIEARKLIEERVSMIHDDLTVKVLANTTALERAEMLKSANWQLTVAAKAYDAEHAAKDEIIIKHRLTIEVPERSVNALKAFAATIDAQVISDEVING